MLAAICKAAEEDSDVGLWAADTDGESSQQSDDLDASRSSRLVASSKRPPLLLKCVQCKGVNDNPFYRYCEKCYQVNIFLSSSLFCNSKSKIIYDLSSNLIEGNKLRLYEV